MSIFSHAKHVLRQLNVANFKNLISIEDIKNYLRLMPGNYDENFLNELGGAAILTAEKFLNCKILHREYEMVVYNFTNGMIDLKEQGITDILEVSVIDSKGIKTIIEDTHYTLNYHKNLVVIDNVKNGKVVIKYSVGYSNQSLPKSIKMGVLMHIGEMYDNGINAEILPKSVMGLYSLHRVRKI